MGQQDKGDLKIERLRADRRAASRVREGVGLARLRALRHAGISKSFRRRRALGTARIYAPPLAAAMVVALSGHPGPGLVIAGGLTLLSTWSRGSLSYPLTLMTATRYALAVLPGVIGLAVIGLVLVIPPEESDDFVRKMISGIPVAVVIGLLIEMSARRWLHSNPVRVAVLDDPVFALGLQQEMLESGVGEFEVIGWLDTSRMRGDAPSTADGEAVRSSVSRFDIEMIVRGRSVEGGARSGADYSEVAEALIDLPVRMVDGNQLYERVLGHVPMGTMSSGWYLFLMHPSYQAARRLPIRLLDLLVSIPVAVVALPLVAVSAIALKLEDWASPVLFRQVRVGEAGRPFEIIKLRTMVDGSGGGEAAWSAGGDLRVTRVGRVLRRLHFDELTQLVNVLRGEMSLVGPRPEQPEMVEALRHVFPHYERRLLIKPGVTGWAQIRCGYAGSTLGTAWKVCHDLFYFKHRNVCTNLALLLETGVIAAKDSHRPLRAPGSQFLFGQELGIELESEEQIAISDLERALNDAQANGGPDVAVQPI